MRLERALAALALVTVCAHVAYAQDGPASLTPTAADSSADVEAAESSDYQLFYIKGRDYGTDAYAGPFDVILNKGLAVAQWQGQDRHLFSYDYGWRAVWASVTHPGKAMERSGGWGKVLKRNLLPFGGDEFRQGQWVPNYFGHVFEGGLAYRRLLEWNRANGVPFPTLTSLLVTQLAVGLNEAYETPVNDPWVQRNGTSGTWVDFMVMDPMGMLLFHQDGITSFFANKLGAVVWPRQASITFPGTVLINNGEAVIMRPKLWFTDDVRLFFRGGIGVEGGLSFPRNDGYEFAFSLGAQSYQRDLDPTNDVEQAQFSPSGGLWLDRNGALLVGVTWDSKTDRRLAIDVFPGVISIGGTTIGAWFQFDRYYKPYAGITGRRTLGLGLGAGF